jgi:hypothetical protein
MYLSYQISDPPQIQVVVDEDNQCRAISPKSKNTNERTEDINFQFTGFTVSGKVFCKTSI